MSIRKNLWIRFLMFFGGMLCMVLVANAIPGLGNSTAFYQGTSAGAQLSVVSFGDSIASGFDSQDIFQMIDGGPYADHLGSWLRDYTGHSVYVNNLAWAGYTMSQIFGKIFNYQPDIQTADIIFLEGGGNDLLALEGNPKIDLCDYNSYQGAAVAIRDNFMKSIDVVNQNKREGAKVSVIGFYYPQVNYLRQRPCYGEQSANGRDYSQVHEHFLDVLAFINWEFRAAAQANGFSYADVFAKMNCDIDHQAACRINNFASEEDYRQGLHSFDEQGILEDMLDNGHGQADDTHPSPAGHELIKDAIVASARH